MYRGMFNIIIARRTSKNAKWEWRVCNLADSALASGRERTRSAARYEAYRALFQVLVVSAARVNLGQTGATGVDPRSRGARGL